MGIMRAVSRIRLACIFRRLGKFEHSLSRIAEIFYILLVERKRVEEGATAKSFVLRRDFNEGFKMNLGAKNELACSPISSRYPVPIQLADLSKFPVPLFPTSRTRAC